MYLPGVACMNYIGMQMHAIQLQSPELPTLETHFFKPHTNNQTNRTTSQGNRFNQVVLSPNQLSEQLNRPSSHTHQLRLYCQA